MKYKIFLYHEEDVFMQNTPPIHFEEFDTDIMPCAGDIILLMQEKREFFVVKTRMYVPANNSFMLFGKKVIAGVGFRKSPVVMPIKSIIKKLEEIHPELADPKCYDSHEFMKITIEEWYQELKTMTEKN